MMHSIIDDADDMRNFYFRAASSSTDFYIKKEGGVFVPINKTMRAFVTLQTYASLDMSVVQTKNRNEFEIWIKNPTKPYKIK